MGSLALCVSIILSTVFIKQHSVFDVMTAIALGSVMYTFTYRREVVLGAVMYILVYGLDIVTVWQHRRFHVRRGRLPQA